MACHELMLCRCHPPRRARVAPTAAVPPSRPLPPLPLLGLAGVRSYEVEFFELSIFHNHSKPFDNRNGGIVFVIGIDQALENPFPHLELVSQYEVP